MDEGNWEDVHDDDEEPMDDQVEITREGEEIHILLERLGGLVDNDSGIMVF